MAPRGSGKWLSRQQEDRIASSYSGTVSPSSGAAQVDNGDVRTADSLIECKLTGSYDKPAKSISIKLDVLEKICDEAWSEGLTPVMALTIVNGNSILADGNGCIDLIVRLREDDQDRG